jgi:hypothetical protein
LARGNWLPLLWAMVAAVALPEGVVFAAIAVDPRVLFTHLT